jgi:hypothetical protein
VDLGCLPGFAGLFFISMEGWYTENAGAIFGDAPATFFFDTV